MGPLWLFTQFGLRRGSELERNEEKGESPTARKVQEPPEKKKVPEREHLSTCAAWKERDGAKAHLYK